MILQTNAKFGAAVCVLALYFLFGLSSALAEDKEAASQKSLSACEKEIGRDIFHIIVQSGYVKRGTITGLSYKSFKLSNSLDQKNIKLFLRDHGVVNPRTVRKITRPVTKFVHGKVFKGLSVVGMTVGTTI